MKLALVLVLSSMATGAIRHPREPITYSAYAARLHEARVVLDNLRGIPGSRSLARARRLILDLLALLLVAGCVAGAGFLLARVRIARALSLEPSTDEGEPASVKGAQERAGQFAGRGEYRLALRYLVLATMIRLQDHGA